MMLIVDPAALGGIAGLIAITGWTIGRAHGSLPAAERPDHPDQARPGQPVADSAGPDRPRAAPCQQRALEERLAELTRPYALAELHAEASAIRRDERILGAVPCEDALTVLTRAAPEAACRFIGSNSRPACAESVSYQAAGDQPSPDVSSLTRV